MEKFRKLNADEIDVRVGKVFSTDKFQGVSLLLYKDARVDMVILDETVGPERWQRRHYEVKNNMYCSVGIKVDDEWVWKDDCGAESNTEKEKGEASDSFKRACVNWGIGRELYTAPTVFVSCEIVKDNKNRDVPKRGISWFVKEIDYNDSGAISKLVVAQKTKGAADEDVFSWWTKSTVKKPGKPKVDIDKDLQQALAYQFERGGKTYTLGDLSLEWLVKNKDCNVNAAFKDKIELVIAYKESEEMFKGDDNG